MCTNLKIYKNRVVPCGKCPQCKKKMRNEWFVRMSCENIQQKYTPFFCTFTYNDDNLPENGLFKYSDFQSFLKKVRIYISRKKYDYKLRYIVVGEFGSKQKTERSHYHAILYGVPYNKEFIDLFRKYWVYGFSDYKPAKAGAFNYVTKYCVKSLGRFKDIVDSETGEITRYYEFKRSSQGLGRSWLLREDIQEKIMNQVLHNDFDFRIKLGKFNYSLPYSWKRKVAEDFKYSLDTKEDVVLYINENRIVKDGYIFKVLKTKWPNLKFSLRNKRETFKELISKFENNIQKEKAFFQKEKKDYFQFYKSSFMKFPSIDKMKEILYNNFSFVVL